MAIPAEPIQPPHPFGGTRDSGTLAVVTTVNPDRSVDTRSAAGRGGKAGVSLPSWYIPTPGDRVLVADTDGDVQRPAIVQYLYAQAGTATGPHLLPGVVDVRSRGARYDGSDDSAAVQAVLTAATPGTCIVFPAGLCSTGPLALSGKTGVQIMLLPGAIWKNGAGEALIGLTITGCQDVWVGGPGKLQMNGLGDAIRFIESPDCQADVILEPLTNCAIGVNVTSNSDRCEVRVRDRDASRRHWESVFVEPSCDDVKVLKSHINGVRSRGIDHRGNRGKIRGNTILNPVTHGILYWPQGGKTGAANHLNGHGEVIGNTIQGAGGYGIFASGEGTPLDTGVLWENWATVIAGNPIHACNSGISIETAVYGACVVGNPITDTVQDAIALTRQVHKALIQGNPILTAGRYGINVASFAGTDHNDDVRLLDNPIFGTGSDGIYAENVRALMIDGNSVRSAGGFDLHVLNAASTFFRGDNLFAGDGAGATSLAGTEFALNHGL